MELTYDWRSFQSMFYPQRRSAAGQGAEPSGKIFVVVEKDVVLAAFAESEDLRDWIGAPLQEMSKEFPHRKVIQLQRKDVDQWITDGVKLPHYFDQIESWGSAAAQADAQWDACGRKHFLLEALQGWWGKVLPSAYGVFVRLEGKSGAPDRDFFLIVRRGRFDCFHDPDLTSMGADRKRVPAEVVKYLSEKHLVSVQGVFVSAQEWLDWAESADPWRLVARALKSGSFKMVPFRWTVASLVAGRALT